MLHWWLCWKSWSRCMQGLFPRMRGIIGAEPNVVRKNEMNDLNKLAFFMGCVLGFYWFWLGAYTGGFALGLAMVWVSEMVKLQRKPWICGKEMEIFMPCHNVFANIFN